ASIYGIGGRLGDEARREVLEQGVAADAIEVLIRAHIRYAGTDTALVVPAFSASCPGTSATQARPTLPAMTSASEPAHKARFGFIDETKELVVEAVSVEAIGGGAKFKEPVLATARTPLPSPARPVQFYSHGHWHEAAVFTRDQLSPSH